MLSHVNITAVLAQMALHITRYEHGRDVILGVAPFYHVLGGHIVVLLSWLKGVPAVVLPKFEPQSFSAAMEKHKVTVGVFDLQHIQELTRIHFSMPPLSHRSSHSSPGVL